MNRIGSGLAAYSSTTPLFTTAFWVAWITVIYSGDVIVAPAIGEYETTAIVFSISTATLGIVLILAGIFSEGASRLISSKPFMYGTAAVCSAATAGVAFEGTLSPAAFAACAALTGATTALIALRGISLYAEVGTQKAAITSCFSLIVGLLVYAFVSMAAAYYGPLGALAIEAALPFLSVIAAFIPLPAEEAALPKDGADLDISTAFWRLAAFMAIIAFSVSSIRGMYPKLISAEAFSASRCTVALMLIIMAGGIIALVSSKPRGYAFGKLFYWLFVGSVALVAPVIVAGVDSPTMGMLASIANGLLLLMAWNFLARVSYCSGMSSVRVFGFGFGVAVLGVTLGFVAGDVLGSWASSNSSLVALAFLLACVFAVIFLLRERDVKACMAPTNAMLMGLDEEEAATPAQTNTPRECSRVLANGDVCPLAQTCEGHTSEVPSKSSANESIPAAAEKAVAPEGPAKRGKFLQKCDAIAQQYGLTAREAEVFELLAKHMEAQAIADALFISFNTTRTHIRKIYGKLDVHSRRELTELIDTYELK